MRTKIAVLFMMLTAALPAYAVGPYGKISVAGWSGGAYTDDKTGEFSNCIAAASYRGGFSFGVLVSKTYSWTLAFTHPSWTLETGQKFPIVLSFDGRTTFNVDGVAVTKTTVFVPMPDSSPLIKSFRAARTMSAFAQGNLYQFSLDGTSVLMPALVNCVKTINAGGLAAATNFTATATANSTPKLVGPRTSPTTASSIEPSRPQEGSPELQMEAMQLASNFILKASTLTHPSLVARSETPVSISSTGAAWKADNAAGFVRIIPPRPNVVGLDVAAAIVGNDAKECKGKFASARNSELVDSEVVFRGMSSCEDSEKSVITEYFIFPRKGGGFIMFSVLIPTSGHKPTASGSASRRTKRRLPQSGLYFDPAMIALIFKLATDPHDRGSLHRVEKARPKAMPAHPRANRKRLGEINHDSPLRLHLN